MSLRFISFADLLEIGGDSGNSGDAGGKANIHAGLTVPACVKPPDPPEFWSGDGGNAIKGGGDARTQYPCGFPADDPTVPTVPTDLEPPSLEPPIDPAEWQELDRAYQQHHFSCKRCVAAGRGAGNGLRCGIGAALWRAYSDVPRPIVTKPERI